ncbi:MAG TPA: undecaprenyl-diphosphate phosphatase [Streptosporangiaceae bacterium]|nr:undecaprenyl-diphosphate phosphatase [Streptosporangiaceae bacterium]
MIHQLTYLQAIVIGLIQGLTELFPISSLGHTVLIPSWFGGSWAALVSEESRAESPYLAFVVGLHLATALVLIGYYWREWLRLIRGLVTSLISRRIETADQRLAWLIVIATIPVGLAGLALEHAFRVLFARPEAAALFLMINGGILFLGERYRRRAGQPVPPTGAQLAARAAGSADVTAAGAVGAAPAAAGPAAAAAAGSAMSVSPAVSAAPAVADNSKKRAGKHAGATVPGGSGAVTRQDRSGPGHTPIDEVSEQRLAAIGWRSALWIGAAQILALFAGISREGVTMAGGLVRGLSHEDAMRFSFLLSTPVILAAGALKIPDLTGPLGAGIRGQVIVGSIAAAATSLLAIVFLSRYFRTRTLTPFAIYCLAAGLISLIRFI